VNINKYIYEKFYSDKNLRLDPQTAYDKYIIDLRFSLIKRYGVGKDVLDLCCGTGSYLIPVVETLRSAKGIDFSQTMLTGFLDNIKGRIPSNLYLIKGDAALIPLRDECLDFVFSYTSLYHVPEGSSAILEISRVLRKGGHAALELGNLYSLNTIICNVHHKKSGWAKPFHVPYRKMLRFFDRAGLKIIKRYSFQFLNSYGVPPNLILLYPLAMPLWRKILGVRYKGKILDEWLSGSWPLHHLAFRHIFVVKKNDSKA